MITALLTLFLVLQPAGDAAVNVEAPRKMDPARKQALLVAREAVWRSFFAGDRAALEQLLPGETLAMGAGSSRLADRAAILEGAAQSARSGRKLVRLEFPTTALQWYGNTAILYSTYLYELEKDGQRQSFSGRVTEVFVWRKGRWTNPGWHMDNGK